MKIKKYKYVRADVNMSKPRRVEKVATGKAGVYKKIQVQGDKLIGSDVMGSIFLPMPKAQDVNATAWGKSELNAQGLAAAGLASKLIGQPGETPDERERRLQASILAGLKKIV